jgi:methylglyoxal/glyoxal reductase
MTIRDTGDSARGSEGAALRALDAATTPDPAMGGPAATLNNGVRIPLLGLGVFRAAPGEETVRAVLWAIEAGYRHIDTAAIYDNEHDVGRAVRESGVPREELFVVTKLANADHGHQRALSAFEKSLERLGLDYVDLYLIHWPGNDARDQSWQALQRIAADGRARAIGVSNYRIDHLEHLLSWAEVVPAVNQVEFSPFLYQRELLDYCTAKGIRLEAYSPLTRGRRFGDTRLQAIAKRLGRTPAQVLVRWALQHGLIVIPKSARRERILENADVFGFSLSGEDMAVLDALDERLRVSWNPETLA